ncbi:hypothetical protein FA15DRAFT_706380 [Coprinopsis marcescibilis]|uniref:Fungal-type protein kinase domain-containing protein n=1 Tax=Coprinopsis marcescibilis TaxID=230819 RepID=A0A5C3KQ28_COPMA|nr:hypothetical protein FA15DRAFT_706380 [Coprinopsis marcescibilis]
MPPHVKRKFSELNAEQSSSVQEIIRTFRDTCERLGMDENDASLMELKRIIDKLTNRKHRPFSDVSVTSYNFNNMGIRIQPMEWLPDGETDAKGYGAAASPGALSVDATRINIRNVLKFVSLESEAGCRILINALLIHVASILETDQSGAAIVPKPRSGDTPFASNEHSSGGVVDYMLIYGDKTLRDRIIKSETFAFNDLKTSTSLKCNIYEAKPEELFTPTTCLPKAAMATISKAEQLGLKTFRGCVTSGKKWLFFIWNADQQGGTVHWLDPLPLGERQDTTANLELILGILRDWVEHGHDKDLRFFKYTE